LCDQATDHLLRKGKKNNVMVFPDSSDYDTAALTEGGDNLVFTHSAFGAEKLRYSLNFGKNRTDWMDWEDATTIPKSALSQESEVLLGRKTRRREL